MTHPELYGTPAPPPVRGTPPAPPTFDYVGGTPELDQLLAMEDDLNTKAKAIKEQLDEVKDRIKLALTSVQHKPFPNAPGQPFERYRIAIPGAVVRVLKWKTSRRLDTPALRRDHPDIYAAYAKSSGAWELSREGKA